MKFQQKISNADADLSSMYCTNAFLRFQLANTYTNTVSMDIMLEDKIGRYLDNVWRYAGGVPEYYVDREYPLCCSKDVFPEARVLVKFCTEQSTNVSESSITLITLLRILELRAMYTYGMGMVMDMGVYTSMYTDVHTCRHQ